MDKEQEQDTKERNNEHNESLSQIYTKIESNIVNNTDHTDTNNKNIDDDELNLKIEDHQVPSKVHSDQKSDTRLVQDIEKQEKQKDLLHSYQISNFLDKNQENLSQKDNLISDTCDKAINDTMGNDSSKNTTKTNVKNQKIGNRNIDSSNSSSHIGALSGQLGSLTGSSINSGETRAPRRSSSEAVLTSATGGDLGYFTYSTSSSIFPTNTISSKKKKDKKSSKDDKDKKQDIILPKILKHRRITNSVNEPTMSNRSKINGSLNNVTKEKLIQDIDKRKATRNTKNSSFRDFMIFLYILMDSLSKKFILITKSNINNKWFILLSLAIFFTILHLNLFIGGIVFSLTIFIVSNAVLEFIFDRKFVDSLPAHLQDISRTMYVNEIREKTIQIIDDIGIDASIKKTVGFISMEFDKDNPKSINDLDSVEIILMDGRLIIKYLKDKLKKSVDCFDPIFISVLQNNQFSIALEDYEVSNSLVTKLDRTYQRYVPLCLKYKYSLRGISKIDYSDQDMMIEGSQSSESIQSSFHNENIHFDNNNVKSVRIDGRLRKFYLYFQSSFDKYNWMYYLQQSSQGINFDFGLVDIIKQKIGTNKNVAFSSKSISEKFKDLIAYVNFLQNSVDLKYLSRPEKSLDSIDSQDSFLPSDVFPTAFFLTTVGNRIFWEIAHQKYFHNFATRIIENQLKKFLLPDYISIPKLKNFDFGLQAPIITNTRRPFIDNQGLWIYLDVKSHGGFKASCSVIFNVRRLLAQSKQSKTPYMDDFEIGVDSNYEIKDDLNKMLSSDDDPEKLNNQDLSSNDKNNTQYKPSKNLSSISHSVNIEENKNPNYMMSSGGKIFKFIEKASKNSIVRKFTNLKPINKRIENISKTEISLNIALKDLEGTLVILIPPPPAELLWYSFTPSTKLDFEIEYLYGDKEMSIPMKKHLLVKMKNNIDLIFRRLLTLPNMECLLFNYDRYLEEKGKFGASSSIKQTNSGSSNLQIENKTPIAPKFQTISSNIKNAQKPEN